MAKWIKAKWIATNSGGGNSIIGFKEIKEEFIQRPDGGTDYIKSKPIVVTILPARSNPAENAKPVVKGDQSFIIMKAEFIVQNIPDNIDTLRMMLDKNWIRLDDWGLMEEITNTKLPEKMIEKVIEEEDERIDITPEGADAKKLEKKKAIAEKLRKK